MKLRVEAEIESRYTTIVNVGPRAAHLYTTWRESGEDEDFEELVEEIMGDLKNQMSIRVTDVEIGR